MPRKKKTELELEKPLVEPHPAVLERVQADIAVAQQELDAYQLQKQTVVDLTDRIAQLHKERERLAELIAEPQKKLQAIREAVRQEEKELGKFRDERMQLSVSLKGTTENVDKTIGIRDRLQAEVKALRNKIEQFSQDAESLERHIQEQEAMLQSAEREVAEGEERRIVLEVGIQTLQIECDELKANIAAIGTECRNAVLYRDSLHKENEGREASIRSLDEAIAERKRRKEDDYSVREKKLEERKAELDAQAETIRRYEVNVGRKVIALRQAKENLELATGKKLDIEI